MAQPTISDRYIHVIIDAESDQPAASGADRGSPPAAASSAHSSIACSGSVLAPKKKLKITIPPTWDAKPCRALLKPLAKLYNAKHPSLAPLDIARAQLLAGPSKSPIDLDSALLGGLLGATLRLVLTTTAAIAVASVAATSADDAPPPASPSANASPFALVTLYDTNYDAGHLCAVVNEVCSGVLASGCARI